VSCLNEYALCVFDIVDLFHVNLLWQVLWLKSRTSEVWLERRTNYARSLAVMSMV
jgi:phosphatidylinositol kinase/protein kinase (PI-3  family)